MLFDVVLVAHVINYEVEECGTFSPEIIAIEVEMEVIPSCAQSVTILEGTNLDHRTYYRE